jgi:hypothetical protein
VSPTIRLSDFKQASLPRADRETALQLKALVRLARQLAATAVDLAPAPAEGQLAFSVRRERELLLHGNIARASTHFDV